jgi:hypothetical protein
MTLDTTILLVVVRFARTVGDVIVVAAAVPFTSNVNAGVFVFTPTFPPEAIRIAAVALSLFVIIDALAAVAGFVKME